MCERAVKLQSYINEWLQNEIDRRPRGSVSVTASTSEADYKDLKKLRLSGTEWQHLNAITQMLKKFKKATTNLSNSSRPLIAWTWLMYNRLFDFLNEMNYDLGEELNHTELEEWPDVVKHAATKGKEKLTKYYSRTGSERGYLYNCATILDLTQKLTAYEVPLLQPFITAMC